MYLYVCCRRGAAARHSAVAGLWSNLGSFPFYVFRISQRAAKRLKTAGKDKFTVYPVNASTGYTKKQMEDDQAKITFSDEAFWDAKARERMNKFMELFQGSCRKTLQNKEFMTWLKESKFDLAFVHMYHACPLGLAHAAGIPFVWLNR